MTGYDTAGSIQNTYAAANSEFGVNPSFWIRYFTPSPAADLFNDDAVAESQGAWDSGGPYVGCISAPRQSRLTVFPLGSGTARLSVSAPGPWAGGEPVITLPAGDAARLVRGRDVQVCSARTGAVTELGIPVFGQVRAKPSAVTMQARSDGTVFMTKPGAGVAVIADPAEKFRTTAQIRFPLPAAPLGAPWSKAVLSPAGDTCYVLGPAATGGLSAYDVGSGKVAGSYSDGSQYAGLYQLPSGTLLAVRPEKPRLAFFSAGLSPLGTADTNLDVSAVY